MAVVRKIKCRRKSPASQKQTFSMLEDNYAPKNSPARQTLSKCGRKCQDSNQTSNYNKIRASKLKQSNRCESVFGSMVQIKPCSVMLKRISIRDVYEYNRILKNEKNIYRKVPLVSQMESCLSVCNAQMPIVDKSVEKISATSKRQISTLQSKRKCSIPETNASIGKRTKYIRKCVLKKQILSEQSTISSVSFQKQVLSKHSRKSSSIFNRLSQLKPNSYTEPVPIDDIALVRNSSQLYKTITDQNSLNNLQMPFVEKCEPAKKFSATLGKEFVQKIKIRRQPFISESQNSSNNVHIPIVNQYEPNDKFSATAKKHMSAVHKTKSRRKYLIYETQNSNKVLNLVKKYEPVEKFSATSEKQVSTVHKVKSKTNCCTPETQNSSHNVQTPVQESESVEKVLATPKKMICTLQKTKSRRKYSVPEDTPSPTAKRTRRNSSVSESQKSSTTPAIEKSEPNEKFSVPSEKQVSVVHKVKSKTKHSVSKTQNSSNNILMCAVQKLEPVVKVSATPEKLSLQSKRKCSIFETHRSISKRTKYTRKCVLKQQTLPVQIAISSASFQKQILPKHDRISSSTLNRLDQVKPNSCTKTVPVDDITLGRNSFELYATRTDHTFQKQVSHKKKPRKKSVNKRTTVQETRKGKKSTSKKQKTAPKRTQSQEKASSKCNGKSSTSRRSIQVECSNFVRNIPIDDLSVRSRYPKLESRTSRSSNKDFLKRKRNAFEAMKNADKGYEDDLYEFKNFDKFKELFVDTSLSPVSSSMPTPVLGVQLTPRIHQKSPKFVDAISLSDYTLYRKVAEECMYKNNPERKGANSQIVLKCNVSARIMAEEEQKNAAPKRSYMRPEQKILGFNQVMENVCRVQKTIEKLTEDASDSDNSYFSVA